MSNHSEIVLEDRNIYGLNKVHKNVLKGAPDVYTTKARVIHKPERPEDTDDVQINEQLLDFVSDGFKFTPEVVRSKAKHALPYKTNLVNEIFEDRNKLGNDIFLVKRQKSVIFNKYPNNSERIRTERKNNSNEMLCIENGENNYDALNAEYALVKFKPKNYFNNKFASSSDLSMAEGDEVKNLNQRSKSLDNINEDIEVEGVFLTETRPESAEKKLVKKNEPSQLKQSLNENALDLQLVEQPKQKWDDHLLSQLSENTARWIAMKNTSDTKQKRKLIEMVEARYGKYTHRELKDLELYEYDLTEYEKKRISEEKQRLAVEKYNQENPTKTVVVQETKETPTYRLPAGLKREAIYQKKLPDTNANKTAKAISFEPTQLDTPKSYEQKMRFKNITASTMLIPENEYERDMIVAGGRLKHEYTHNLDEKIVLSDGKTFAKNVQQVFPAEFTAWISNVNLAPENKPEMVKPVKGKKRWTDFPKVIDDSKILNPNEVPQSYWELMPTTPDTQLRRIAKSNLTVSKIIDEWRKRWQTSSRWTMAEIEELITDMNDPSPNIRFQAIVICSRAVEQIQIMIHKLKKYNKKNPTRRNSNGSDSTIKDDRTGESLFDPINYEDVENLIFSAKLFDTIEKRLGDTNQKVRLSAAIAIFVILRSFQRPMLEKMQTSKNSAEVIVREHLDARSKADRYTAAQCLCIDGYCEAKPIEILLKNYFESTEQFTKQQVSKTLSDLSRYHELVMTLVASYLNSDFERQRILSCKLIPCLRRSVNKDVTAQLISLMWHDFSRTVKKVASQTLGRTGRGREVHQEIYLRLKDGNTFERIEALKKINAIGIMTDKLLKVFLKCFRDDHPVIRELACRSSQCLFENHEKLIDSLIFMVKYDPVDRLKAMGIRALSLIGEFNSEIRQCLLWSLQFEIDPSIRTEACHCIMILIKNHKDDELMNILLERHLLETEPIVKSEIKSALNHLGYNPKRELPVVSKIKADVTRMGSKTLIISKIKELETKLTFEEDKGRLLWLDQDDINAANLRKAKKDLEILEEVATENLAVNESPELIKPKKKITSKSITFDPELDKLTNVSFLETLIMNEDPNGSKIDDSRPESDRTVSVTISNPVLA